VGIFSKCRPDECFKGAGSDSQKHIETGFFKEVNIYGIFDVLLVEDTSYYVEFEGGENMVEQASANNTDSVLFIDNSNSCYFLKDYQKIKLYLHFNTVNAVYVKDACTIRTEKPITNIFRLIDEGQVADIDIELNNDHFFFYNHKTSGGKYIFRGWCTNCIIYGYYMGQVDASNLNTGNINIENHSVTDYYVRAEETVHAEIHNSGNIYVYGNPVIFVDSIQGSGKVIKVEEP